MNESSGQFDRRTFIVSAGATAFALTVPALPTVTGSTGDSIIALARTPDIARLLQVHPGSMENVVPL